MTHVFVEFPHKLSEFSSHNSWFRLCSGSQPDRIRISRHTSGHVCEGVSREVLGWGEPSWLRKGSQLNASVHLLRLPDHGQDTTSCLMPPSTMEPKWTCLPEAGFIRHFITVKIKVTNAVLKLAGRLRGPIPRSTSATLIRQAPLKLVEF